ncbi:MAG: ABC transporter permease subunit [Ignavibacteria bacterium]|nr:ABC transporter permease subunit [Ignavibacteria bacterium]MBK6772504.1 ABC transporter permease subunit [Ignavibacteria bacterium]MBK7158695.1 ABC transporter permease subunit [Ignavibacteria bacterium]MBK7254918.1 ABC transporter permease subunit [Ignavibacteria bacterium]
MTSYFIRRFLLIIPTFLGITLVTFLILQFVPGGPLEMAIMQMRTGGQQGSEQGNNNTTQSIPQEAIEELKKFYGFDKPIYERYIIWVGNLVRFDLGNSYKYNEPVWDVISSRFPVSIYFGLIGFSLTYLICVPLGVYKAVKNGSTFDFVSSALVFIGYSIPGFAFGAMMLVLFGGGSFWDVFPLGGFRSSDWELLSSSEKIWDQVQHTFLPVLSYMIGSFATLTILTKNSVIENLSQDYIRTAYSKGLSEKKVIFGHALRNSLIPISTGLGHAISLVLAGSFLIEKVFNINGMGLLGYESIIERDYPVVMGILVISTVLLLIGNILSDILYAIVDPRIRFK